MTAKGVLFFGSSTWALTRDLRINRKTGSSKVYINQWLISFFGICVIFRVIEPKVAFRNFSDETFKFGLQLHTEAIAHLVANFLPNWGIAEIARVQVQLALHDHVKSSV